MGNFGESPVGVLLLQLILLATLVCCQHSRQGQPQYYGSPSSPPNGPDQGQGSGVTLPTLNAATGFEGFMMPNSWYGLSPYGIEGVVIVIVAGFMCTVIIVNLIALGIWLSGFGPLGVKKRGRSYRDTSSIDEHNSLSFVGNTVDTITVLVHKAVDKYSELVKDDGEAKKLV